MSPKKAPSAGTKVNLGENAPVTEEGIGKVPSDSLADESIQEGGDFAANQGAHSENTPRSEQVSGASYASMARKAGEQTDSSKATDSSKTHEPGQQTSSLKSENVKSYDGTAPTYINNQYQRDPSGPHGKNLQEGGWDESKAEDGLKKALNSDPGSMDDPSRLAEQQFQLKQGAGGRETGPKQDNVTNKTPYDALSSEVSS